MRVRKTYATGLVKPKTTALFFDKLFVPHPYSKRIPCSLLFDYDGSIKEVFQRKNKEWGVFYVSAEQHNSGLNPFGKQNDFECVSYCNEAYFSDSLTEDLGVKEKDNTIISNLSSFNRKHETKKEDDKRRDFLLSYYRNREIQNMVQGMRKYFRVNIVPIFFDKTDYEKSLDISNPNMQGFQTDNKDHSVYEAIINCDKMIDEDELSWEQVLEIRKDRKSILKLRKFRNWADNSFQKYSGDRIVESIEKEYEDYSEALKKHGVKMIKGGFATLGIAAGTIMNTWGGNIVNYMGAGLTIAVSSVPFIKEVKKYIDVRKQPIAYYYDITKKFSKE